MWGMVSDFLPVELPRGFCSCCCCPRGWDRPASNILRAPPACFSRCSCCFCAWSLDGLPRAIILCFPPIHRGVYKNKHKPTSEGSLVCYGDTLRADGVYMNRGVCRQGQFLLTFSQRFTKMDRRWWTWNHGKRMKDCLWCRSKAKKSLWDLESVLYCILF